MTYRPLYNKLFQNLEVKTTISSHTVSVGQEFESGLVGVLARGLSEVAVRCWPGPQWGWRISFQDGSFAWLARWCCWQEANTHDPPHVGLSRELLECPYNTEASCPQSEAAEREQGGRSSVLTADLRMSHASSSAPFE